MLDFYFYFPKKCNVCKKLYILTKNQVSNLNLYLESNIVVKD